MFWDLRIAFWFFYQTNHRTYRTQSHFFPTDHVADKGSYGPYLALIDGQEHPQRPHRGQSAWPLLETDLWSKSPKSAKFGQF